VDLLLDLSKVVSLAMSILSLCALLDSAFFIPATRWEDRLIASVVLCAAAVAQSSALKFRPARRGGRAALTPASSNYFS